MTGQDLATAATIAKRQYRRWYNCWGFVAWVMNWVDYLTMLDENLMVEFLKARTRVVDEKEIQTGDLIVYWVMIHGKRNLIHTAFVWNVENMEVLHKPDRTHQLEYQIEKLVHDKYWIADDVEFRRPV